MSIRLILADFDGTLIDSMPFWRELPKDTLRENALPIPNDMDELILSRPMWQIAELFSSRYECFPDRDALYAGWMARMLHSYKTVIPFKPGAVETLAALKERGVPVCLFSATNHALLDPVLEARALLAYLAGVITEGDAGASKRFPAPYELAFSRFGVKPEETLLIEDSGPNIHAAKALGVRCCGVYDETMSPSWESIRAEADVSLLSLAENAPLFGLIDSLK